jgi:hypothetical protein
MCETEMSAGPHNLQRLQGRLFPLLFEQLVVAGSLAYGCIPLICLIFSLCLLQLHVLLD